MTKYNFIVVGSGAAGAASAWRLVSKGYKLCCVERGPSLGAGPVELTNRPKGQNFEKYKSIFQ